MTSFRERIDKLSSVVGHSFNSHERAIIINLENDIENTAQDIEDRKQLLQSLEEQSIAHRAELEVQVDLDNAYVGSIQQDIKAMRERSEILQTYISIMDTDEFKINKLRVEEEVANKEFWLELKPLLDRSRSIAEELKKINELEAKRDELIQKANTLMAPSH